MASTPEQKSLGDAADLVGCAGIKIRQLEALCRRRHRSGMQRVELYAKVRYAVRIEVLSERAAARRFGITPRTVAKMMCLGSATLASLIRACTNVVTVCVTQEIERRCSK